MNSLIERFGSRLAVLSFPCNQFGHQENNNKEELLNMLKYIRPGDNFEPLFDIFGKIEVNGNNTHPVFQYLKERLPVPHDDPVSLMSNPQLIIWSPIRRYDISWNFEKFLIRPNGEPFKRYSRHFETINIADDIEKVLEEAS